MCWEDKSRIDSLDISLYTIKVTATSISASKKKKKPFEIQHKNCFGEGLYINQHFYTGRTDDLNASQEDV